MVAVGTEEDRVSIDFCLRTSGNMFGDFEQLWTELRRGTCSSTGQVALTVLVMPSVNLVIWISPGVSCHLGCILCARVQAESSRELLSNARSIYCRGGICPLENLVDVPILAHDRLEQEVEVDFLPSSQVKEEK